MTLTAARPSCAGEASNAAAIAAFDFGACMRASSPSNCVLRSSRPGERDLTSDSNSAYDNSTAFGASCFVMATAPPRAACSKMAPNSFLKRLAATVGRSTSSP